jgi:hypothetical protein
MGLWVPAGPEVTGWDRKGRHDSWEGGKERVLAFGGHIEKVL